MRDKHGGYGHTTTTHSAAKGIVAIGMNAVAYATPRSGYGILHAKT